MRVFCVVRRRRPEELELLVCGGRSLDLSTLQAATLYDDGYCKDSVVSDCSHLWDLLCFGRLGRSQSPVAGRMATPSPPQGGRGDTRAWPGAGGEQRRTMAQA